jgi:hypothetical protein
MAFILDLQGLEAPTHEFVGRCSSLSATHCCNFTVQFAE